MTALRAMLPWDVRLQVRYGLYPVYAVLTVLFVLGVRLVEPSLRTHAAVLLVALDPTALGFYFVAALVLFEKREGVLDALVASPLSDRGYLASKTITLSVLATLVSTVVAVLGHGGAGPRLLVLVAGVALSASLFVLVGFVAVARFDSVNEYFLTAVVWGGVLFVPSLVGYVGLVASPLVYLSPTQAVLLVVEAGFRQVGPWRLLYAFGYLLVGNAVAYAWARRAFRAHVVRGGDPGRQLGRTTVPQHDERPERRGLRAHAPWTAMVLTDVRNWIRDPMLAVAAVGPLVMAGVLRIGLPPLASRAAPLFDVTPYYPVIAGAVVVFGPAIYGFVVGMFVLEDREGGLLTAYRTSPLSARGYLAYRCATAYVFSLATTLPAVLLVDLVPAQPTVVLGTAAVSALSAPFAALAFGTLASNTIEGLAIGKFANLVFLGPAAVVALVPEPLQFAAGVLPTYWAVKAFAVAATGGAAWPRYLAAGVVVHAVGIGALARWFTAHAE